MSLKITSPEALDTTVAEVVRLKIALTARTAEKDGEVAAVEKRHQPKLTELLERITALEGEVRDFAEAHRAELFAEQKSRETSLAVFGFELTPWRVEAASRKIRWSQVVARLQRLPWGKAYVRQPDPLPDKNALLADREQFSPEQLTAAGIQFARDDQFFLRPKPDTAV